MTNNKSLTQHLKDSKKEISYIFLGIGIALFILNITSFITFVVTKSYPYFLFDLSIFSAILLIVFSVYEIFKEK